MLRRSRLPIAFALATFAWTSTMLANAGCVTVRPAERAILADPIMQFGADPQANAQLRHAIDNREGSYGGAGVAGGGCGCN